MILLFRGPVDIRVCRQILSTGTGKIARRHHEVKLSKLYNEVSSGINLLQG